MAPVEHPGTTAETAGADYVPTDPDAPYTPDTDESVRIADPPARTGEFATPDETSFENTAPTRPARVVPIACADMQPFTTTVNPATVGDGRPQLVVGAQPNRRGVTVYNLGTTELYFARHQEVTPNDGTLPAGQAWSGDYWGAIYMLASAAPLRVSIVPLFEQ